RGLPQTRGCRGLAASTSSAGGRALAGRPLLRPARAGRAGQLSPGVGGGPVVLRGPLRPCRLAGIGGGGAALVHPCLRRRLRPAGAAGAAPEPAVATTPHLDASGSFHLKA